MSYTRTRRCARNRGSYLTVAEDVATTDNHGTCSWMPPVPPQVCCSTGMAIYEAVMTCSLRGPPYWARYVRHRTVLVYLHTQGV